MKKKRNIFLAALLVMAMLLTGGCGPKINSEQITQLDRADTGADSNAPEEEEAEPLKEDNELPEDGIITTAQMKTISGEEGEYKFHGEDKSSGITYTWIYEGKKIRNPQEQKMKVSFVTDAAEVDQVKKSANNAAVGLGFTLEKENMAAPPRLVITLNEKWNADTVILCKMVDGVPKKMADVTIDQSTGKDSKEVTTLTFPVTEVGDTYYLVGGKTKADSTSADGTDNKQNPSGGTDGTGENQTAAGENQASTEGNQTSTEGNNQDTSQQSDTTQSDHTCTISIECSTILNNWDDLNEAKADFVPSDGWILYSSVVEYTPGETVYDVLYRVCRDSGIHMSARYTPMYGSYYVEGINQLYEFDCGELSGWMYSVNGWFPNYGCSQYEVSDGDIIEWRYTCDLGRDVGDQYYE